MKPTFRADIEGLRALAILAVVACHAKLPYMQGGFVGVDIFFVLSGYLITAMLVREIATNGRVSFLSFYARRFRRLFPALVLMLLVSSVFAAIFLSPLEHGPHAYSGQAAFLWVSNFYFALSNFGYFEAGSAGNIFLHTWSLCVEEQFYLLWPALILAIVNSNKPLITSLVVVFSACLALSIYLSYTHPLWGFYSMPSRGWQFALGGIVCLLTTSKPPKTYHSTTICALAGYGGLTLILASILLIDEQMTYPGFASLAPSLGAALIIHARESSTSKALSVTPMLVIGRISYSWYLWHWPVLVLGGLIFHRQDLEFQLMLVLISFTLAVIAYITVENPIRSKKFKPIHVVMASICVMFLGVALTNAWIRLAPQWADAPGMFVYDAARADLPQIYDNSGDCDSWYESAEVVACSFGPEDADHTVVIFGDSVLAQWFSAFHLIYVEKGWNLKVLTKSACPMVDESIYYEPAKGIYAVCDEWRDSTIDYLKELKPDTVFMGSSATYDFSDEQWLSGTKRIVEPLSNAAGKVYIIRGTPRLTFDGPECLSSEDWRPDFLGGFSGCKSEVSVEPDGNVFAAIKEAIAPFDNARILDFNSFVCPDTVCKAHNGEQFVFRDNAHLTDKFVRSITPQIREKIAQAE